jgi:hypothetical protein
MQKHVQMLIDNGLDGRISLREDGTERQQGTT